MEREIETGPAAVPRGTMTDDVATLLHRALIHHEKREYPEANRLYTSILERDPLNVDAWHLLGMICYDSGRPEAAAAMIQRALALNPDFAEAWNNLGNAYATLGLHGQAVDAFETALRLKPANGLFWLNLGNSRRALGQFDKAITAYERSIELIPGNGVARYHLSACAHALRRFDQAEAAARQGLAMEPESVPLLLTLGRALIGQERHIEAAECLERALTLQPDKLDTLLETATIFEHWRMPDRAAQFYRLALERAPDHAQALARYLDMQLSLCDWSDYDEFCARLIRRIEGEMAKDQPVSTDVFNLHALPVDQDFTFRMARHKARHMAAEAAERKSRLAFAFPEPSRDRRIRLGYLLPYTTKQSMPLVLEPLIENHDRERFEVFGYSLMACDGVPFSVAFRKRFDHFTDLVKLDPAIAAARLHADGIDILIDTTGHTSVNYLEVLALQPAPIQVHYLGYSLTTGSDFVQYLITDRRFMPPEWQRYCTEELVYLPDSFMATVRAEISPAPVSRAEFGLPEEGFVFANFNHPCKFEPGIFDIWMRILDRVPGSVLWLGQWMHATDEKLKHEAERRGIAPERLIFARLMDHPLHLKRLQLADLALDNRRHGGGVTTVDALWTGVPILTIAGESPPARLGATLCTAAGVPEMIAPDLVEYERRAIAFGRGEEDLASVRQRLWASRLTCPLFDGERYRRHLEAAYERMWEIRCAGEAPRRIEIAPIG